MTDPAHCEGKRQNIGYCTHQNYHDIITFCKEMSLDFIFYDRAIIYVRGESKKINDFLKSFDRLRVESWHDDALEVIYIHENNNLDVRAHPEKYLTAEKFLECWERGEIWARKRKKGCANSMRKITREDLEEQFEHLHSSGFRNRFGVRQIIESADNTVTIGKIFPENYSRFRNIEISIGLDVLNSYKKYFINNEYMLKKVIYVSGKLDEMIEFCKKIEEDNEEIKELSKDQVIRLNDEGMEIIWIMRPEYEG